VSNNDNDDDEMTIIIIILREMVFLFQRLSIALQYQYCCLCWSVLTIPIPIHLWQHFSLYLLISTGKHTPNGKKTNGHKQVIQDIILQRLNNWWQNTFKNDKTWKNDTILC